MEITLVICVLIVFIENKTGVAGQTTIDACQSVNTKARAFRIQASYYRDRPGICACAIGIVPFNGSINGKDPIRFRANVKVLDGDGCGYTFVTIENKRFSMNNCSTCIGSTGMVFYKDDGYTRAIGRSYDHPSLRWFLIELQEKDLRRQLRVRCWLIKGQTVGPPCDDGDKVGYGGGEQGTPYPNVTGTMATEAPVNQRGDTCTESVSGILGWCVSGILILVVVGLVIYIRIKSRKESKSTRLDTPPADTHTYDVYTDPAELDDAAYQGNNNGNISTYEDLQQRSTDEQVYDGIVETTQPDTSEYEQPIVTQPSN